MHVTYVVGVRDLQTTGKRKTYQIHHVGNIPVIGHKHPVAVLGHTQE